ncbi:glycosyltransferase [Kineococcus sp. TRM81007]|uniref:glycosyltransferase family 2 protein n=1 Tax=Kineococcus sp. TRM81007 TaxID=2925831 RepID=UPI001F568225|nr:glycosyltransferase [Kineococcus sp. TRM81007]MCI2239947.1 glycosyltransferase [Kineococcus sp. TRM81007]
MPGARDVGRSRPLRGRRRALALLAPALFLGYVLWSYFGWASTDVAFLITFFGVNAVLVTCFLVSGTFWRSFSHLNPAHGRVLCIVPVYNEEDHLVHAAVRALLRQTILPDEIHVVDDGSVVPVGTFDDPLVRWHRIANSGKRHAQAHVLRMFSAREFDFVLTVDSDSVLDDDALERMLEAMSDDRVQACTGMILMRNWNVNLLTRLTDINVVTSCLLFRMVRSWLGIVSPTSGALALYRSAVIYDNLEDYVTSGTAGDDRRLSFYALLRGQVVGVSEAVVATQLPTTWDGAFRQRMRWSKSAWLGTGFVWTNLRWLVVVFYTFPLVFALLWPLAVAVLITLSVRYGSLALGYGILYWVVCAITQTAVYAVYRPGFTLAERLQQWALSPVYPVFGLVILRPAAYAALTKLRSTSWHTREVILPAAEAVPAAVAAPATGTPAP